MAGQLKEVRNRIKSVQSTQQITKAMKMVSAAKLRRAQDAIGPGMFNAISIKDAEEFADDLNLNGFPALGPSSSRSMARHS